MRDEVYVGALFSEEYLAHYGKGHDDNPPGRGSGRYPWGSGKNPRQHEEDLKTIFESIIGKMLKTRISKRVIRREDLKRLD